MCERSGVPTEGKQEGGGSALRAGRGQDFPVCEPRTCHRESVRSEGRRE